MEEVKVRGSLILEGETWVQKSCGVCMVVLLLLNWGMQEYRGEVDIKYRTE